MEMECFVQRDILESERVNAEARRVKYLCIRVRHRQVYWLRNKMRLCDLPLPTAPRPHLKK